MTIFKVMKRVFSALAIVGLLLSSADSFAQSDVESLRSSKRIVTWTEADLPNFAIQLLATKTPPTDPSFVKSLDVVYEYFSGDGFVRYYFGSFSTFAEANKSLQDVKGKGYEGAFVAKPKSSSSKSSSHGLETTGHKKIEIDPDKTYVVQVGAFRYPLYISYFEKVGDVFEYRLNDKIFRYTTKPVKGSEVERELDRVKKLGYDAAFIVEYDLYAPYKID